MEDKILTPTTGRGLGYLKSLGDKLNSIIPDKFTDTTGPYIHFGNDQLTVTKILELAGFGALRTALIEFSPLSIDAFLRDNPNHLEAGNAMIIYSLLKREDKELFKIQTKSMKKKTESEEDKLDNWYPCFINDLTSGCAGNPKELLKNKIEVITFNYDLSLEYFLYSRLQNVHVFKDSIAKEFLLTKFFCEHVYGSLYDKSIVEISYGIYHENDDTPAFNKTVVNFKRLIFALHNQKNINTMWSERKGADDKALHDEKLAKRKEMINEAKKIFFIGFGFDRDNLNQLGFPSLLKEYKKFFSGKTIHYLNHKGEMTSLDDEFVKIAKHCNRKALLNLGFSKDVSIIRSTNATISDAYKKDFKPSLLG